MSKDYFFLCLYVYVGEDSTRNSLALQRVSVSSSTYTDPPPPPDTTGSGGVDTAVIIWVVVLVAMVIIVFLLILPAFITVLAYMKCKSTSKSMSSTERSANDIILYSSLYVAVRIG